MPCSQQLKNRLPRFHLLLFLLAFAGAPASFGEKFAGIADTPPMGWNSWNHYECEIDENLVRETADAMVANGMRDAGYLYVNLDDCWQGERDKDGFIRADAARFPSGMKALADYVHSKGLKIGLYSDAGKMTCAKRPGSQGYEYQDALQYSRWGIDYLKYDWCHTGEGEAQRNAREAYSTIRDALNAAGRPVILSICEWGGSKPWEWGAEVGHLWRTGPDIVNCWQCQYGHGIWDSLGVLNIFDQQEAYRSYAGPGHWNDPDMLEVGNLPTLSENRAHFALWAMLAAPLIVGTDLVNLDENVLKVLTNKDVIAVNQDKLGIQAFGIFKTPTIDYWAKPLDGGDWAIAILNRTDEPREIHANWPVFNAVDDLTGRVLDFYRDKYAIKDLWTGKSAGTTAEPLKTTIDARDVLIYRFSLQPQ